MAPANKRRKRDHIPRPAHLRSASAADRRRLLRLLLRLLRHEVRVHQALQLSVESAAPAAAQRSVQRALRRQAVHETAGGQRQRVREGRKVNQAEQAACRAGVAGADG